MSVYIVYKQNGVKMMRPVLTSREEYVKLRNSGSKGERGTHPTGRRGAVIWCR